MKQLFESIIYDAIEKNATDIHISILENNCQVKMRIKGEMIQNRILQMEEITKLINYIRYISKIDLNFKNKPQTGTVSIEYQKHTYPLRVSSLMGKNSDTLVIRVLDNHQTITIDDISDDKLIRNFIHSIVEKQNGLFVISGATGSGKSTTLYAILDEIARRYHKNIITLEDPVEIKKEYCLQIELNNRLGITYEQSLKQILRHDPDVIMIGEIRDETTAKLALTCALTGHLVLTTVHGRNCISTLKRLNNLDITMLDLEDVLLGVMTQQLTYRKGKVKINAEFLDRKLLEKYFKTGHVEYQTIENTKKRELNNA